MRCPLCETELPDRASQCTRCDWIRETDSSKSPTEDWLAAALSIVPGLGHLYKGHLVPGILLLCLVGPAFLGMVFILAPATLGLSFLLPAAFVAVVAVRAFHLSNARKHPGIAEQARQTLAAWSSGKREKSRTEPRSAGHS
ncbi:MAG TPA: hypothetical protein VGO90_16845 [Chthoniobacteraceae bacterium]|jgi:hypothetical protein|nr:hypothetical protein [Chthoniobacteraceae bacterium]